MEQKIIQFLSCRPASAASSDPKVPKKDIDITRLVVLGGLTTGGPGEGGANWPIAIARRVPKIKSKSASKAIEERRERKSAFVGFEP